jgi:hypothetical protein
MGKIQSQAIEAAIEALANFALESDRASDRTCSARMPAMRSEF